MRVPNTKSIEVITSDNFSWEKTQVFEEDVFFAIRFVEASTLKEKTIAYFPKTKTLLIDSIVLGVESIDEADRLAKNFSDSNKNLFLPEKYKAEIKLNPHRIKIKLDKSEITDMIINRPNDFCKLNDLLQRMEKRQVIGYIVTDEDSVGIRSLSKASHLILGFYPEKDNILCIEIEWLDTPCGKSARKIWDTTDKLKFQPTINKGELVSFDIVVRQIALV